LLYHLLIIEKPFRHFIKQKRSFRGRPKYQYPKEETLLEPFVGADPLRRAYSIVHKLECNNHEAAIPIRDHTRWKNEFT